MDTRVGLRYGIDLSIGRDEIWIPWRGHLDEIHGFIWGSFDWLRSPERGFRIIVN